MTVLDLKQAAIKQSAHITLVMARMSAELEAIIQAELPESAWPEGWREKIAGLRQLRDHFARLRMEIEQS